MWELVCSLISLYGDALSWCDALMISYLTHVYHPCFLCIIVLMLLLLSVLLVIHSLTLSPSGFLLYFTL